MRPQDAEQTLAAARRDRRSLDPFTDAHPDLDEEWGYAVQSLDRARRTTAGEEIIGAKLGLTSTAKQQRMNIDRPIVGFLTDVMHLPAAKPLDLTAWIQPRIEPEIAFVLGRAVNAPVDLAGAAAAVEAVAAAAEIVDSRYTGYRFGLPDVLADNTSAAAYLLADPRSLRAVGDLAALRCEVMVDGCTVHTATGAAILGHPLRALVHLSEHVAACGETLPAGSVVLAGAMTDAVPLIQGTNFLLRTHGLGEIVARH
ncbi:2-keto-4-pentenoate hydratase [Kocuria rosea]|nr:fumarylacetoacetate hydrolase family protein [Kocuria rosea]